MTKFVCRGCGERFQKEAMVRVNLSWFHDFSCAADFALAKARKKAANDAMRNAKALRSRQREAKAKIKKRTGKNGYYANLQTAINYYVKHVIYRGADCYTCGKKQSPTDSGGAFHVSHYMPAKQVDPRRFLLINLKLGCYTCNALNSGRLAQYRIALIDEIGIEKVEWLECEANHPNLLEVFPNVEDIKAETARYRKLARDFEKQNSII